jgi:hypothetical protein
MRTGRDQSCGPLRHRHQKYMGFWTRPRFAINCRRRACRPCRIAAATTANTWPALEDGPAPIDVDTPSSTRRVPRHHEPSILGSAIRNNRRRGRGSNNTYDRSLLQAERSKHPRPIGQSTQALRTNRASPKRWIRRCKSIHNVTYLKLTLQHNRTILETAYFHTSSPTSPEVDHLSRLTSLEPHQVSPAHICIPPPIIALADFVGPHLGKPFLPSSILLFFSTPPFLVLPPLSLLGGRTKGCSKRQRRKHTVQNPHNLFHTLFQAYCPDLPPPPLFISFIYLFFLSHPNVALVRG